MLNRVYQARDKPSAVSPPEDEVINTPPQTRRHLDSSDSQHRRQSLEFHPCKRFREDVSGILVRSNSNDGDLAVPDDLSDVVVSDIDVFSSRMEYSIVLGESNRSIVVTEEWSRQSERSGDFANESSQPDHFLRSMSSSDVFGFGGR